MKKLLIVAVGVLALLPVANATSSKTPARVAVTDLTPFTVYGSGFAKNEKVKVTVIARQYFKRSVVANTSGSFTARFATVRLERCASYFVRAVGAAGHVAIKKVTPECAPAAGGGTGGTPDPDPLNPTDPTPKKK